MEVQVQLLETRRRGMSQCIVAERGEEGAPTGELRELTRDDGAASGGLLPDLFGMDDLARLRHVRHTGELDPLHVTDDGASHGIAA